MESSTFQLSLEAVANQNSISNDDAGQGAHTILKVHVIPSCLTRQSPLGPVGQTSPESTLCDSSPPMDLQSLNIKPVARIESDQYQFESKYDQRGITWF